MENFEDFVKSSNALIGYNHKMDCEFIDRIINKFNNTGYAEILGMLIG